MDLPAGLKTWANDLLRQIESITTQDFGSKTKQWTTANVPDGTRTIDGNNATLDETRKALARLVKDLKNAGVVA